MGRIRLTPLESYDFSQNIIIPIYLINYGGHVGNDSMPSLMHEIRLQYLKSLDMSELDIGERRGLVVCDMAINFLSEIFHGESVTASISFKEFSHSSFRAYYLFERDNKPVCIAETGVAAFDYTARKISHLPLTFINKFSV